MSQISQQQLAILRTAACQPDEVAGGEHQVLCVHSSV
eukprot:CAMPEP_0204289084 /NCGR_PEP_ID=MMETSP0468-20130131/58023_1 /ASSEMBLY_ACC=CAM_ASM_000383 /TAXON_ID=2969 /ORGANISM="Oxyrrhis marina" /LENGTH=36 /DNA_ID= /DNA_START= /DNA_END= /DNA_ORIENTATION=